MKRNSLLFLLCVISLLTFSQPVILSSRKPVKGDKAISFNLTGLAVMALNSATDTITNDPILDIRYFYKDDMAARIGFGLGTRHRDRTTSSDTSGGQPLVETGRLRKNYSTSVCIGIEKHFQTISRIVDPFICPTINFIKLGGRSDNNFDKMTLANGDFSDIKTVTKNPGGFVIMAQMNAGFFCFLRKGLALGGEFGVGIGRGHTNGNIKETINTTNSVGGAVTNTVVTTNSPYKEISTSFYTVNTGAVVLLIKF